MGYRIVPGEPGNHRCPGLRELAIFVLALVNNNTRTGGSPFGPALDAQARRAQPMKSGRYFPQGALPAVEARPIR